MCVCLLIAYDAEREANITMTYVPAHLYYMLFELLKVRCILSVADNSSNSLLLVQKFGLALLSLLGYFKCSLKTLCLTFYN